MPGAAAELLVEIEAYCRSHRMAESTFGRQAVNDGKLCARLRSGRNVTLETAQRIRSFIESANGAANGGSVSASERGADGSSARLREEPEEVSAMSAKKAKANKKKAGATIYFATDKEVQKNLHYYSKVGRALAKTLRGG